MKQSWLKKNRMETIMRITWALLPLGLLLHCTDANPKQQPSSSSYIASIPTTITAGVTATPSPISTQVTSVASNTATIPTASVTAATNSLTHKVTSVASNTATITTASVTAATNSLTHKVTSVASNTATITTASVTAATNSLTHKVTSVASNTATITTASVTAATNSLTHKVTSVASNTATIPTASVTAATNSLTLKVTSVASNTATITTAGVTPGTSIVTAVGTAGTGASGSSGTLTQTTPDTTEVTQVSTTTSVGPTPWSASSFPSHPPSTSSRVGSGSSLATTTTSTQGRMVSTTTAETTTPPKSFTFAKSQNGENYERKDLEELCRQLMSQMHDANCTLTVRENNGHTTFDSVVMAGKVDNSVVQQYYEEITRKPSDNMTLIAILASCGALLAMIVGFAIYASYHRKSYRKNLQQHLTEELQTVEDGYHDNPTLEVMEVQPEMQEKKVALYGEFNDSWIVPIDSLLKEDMPDEEDTHL
ncbi:podocalyxin-like isoform X4 [Oncorhynchus clarkii lewisi]|uniref:podocalyxin-like isoform X4 n=1 Tax=Oncorhynchus clarkii lewisi TaxID=490388 RepID=UPI0039B8B4E9